MKEIEFVTKVLEYAYEHDASELYGMVNDYLEDDVKYCDILLRIVAKDSCCELGSYNMDILLNVINKKA